MKKVYRITYEKLSGESADILANTWDEAAAKASKWLANLNKELKETGDDRFPDDIKSVELITQVYEESDAS